MNIEFKQIDGTNYNECIELRLNEKQKKYVGWSMSRFMIDVNYQNQGIGEMALQKFIEFFTNKYGHLQLYTSAEIDNQIAIALYEKFGFEKKEVFEYEAGGRKYKEVRMIAQL